MYHDACISLIVTGLVLLQTYFAGLSFAVFAVYFPVAWKKRRPLLMGVCFTCAIVGLGFFFSLLKYHLFSV